MDENRFWITNYYRGWVSGAGYVEALHCWKEESPNYAP
jgi:hypothetical protein